MKKLLYTLLPAAFLFMTAEAGAQSADSSRTNYLFRKKPKSNSRKATGFIMDLGYMQGPSHGRFAPGFAMLTAVHFDYCWATGMRLDMQQHNGFRLQGHTFPAVRPALTFTTATWHNEWMIASRHIVNGSLSLAAGGGFSTYYDRFTHITTYNGSTWVNDSPTLARGAYWVLEPGAAVNVNLFKYIGLSCGAGYRLVSGTTSTGDASDFSGLTARAAVRINMHD